MRVFVTGVKGQLGYDVMNELEKQGLEGIGVVIKFLISASAIPDMYSSTLVVSSKSACSSRARIKSCFFSSAFTLLISE